MTTHKTAIEKLETMADSERLSSTAVDLVSELESDEVEAFADVLSEIATALQEVSANVEEWRDAEGRDDKADAKESAINSINDLLDHVHTLEGTDVPGWLRDLLVLTWAS